VISAVALVVDAVAVFIVAVLEAEHPHFRCWLILRSYLLLLHAHVYFRFGVLVDAMFDFGHGGTMFCLSKTAVLKLQLATEKDDLVVCSNEVLV
jgi:hypothetical protein